MINVLFVGDEPSEKCLDKTVPFVGTRSHANLIKWIKTFPLIKFVLENSHNNISIENVKRYSKLNYKIVALGNKASLRLSKIEIEHFKLPHPSGRNRKLNDVNFINLKLEKCIKYIKKDKNER